MVGLSDGRKTLKDLWTHLTGKETSEKMKKEQGFLFDKSVNFSHFSWIPIYVFPLLSVRMPHFLPNMESASFCHSPSSLLILSAHMVGLPFPIPENLPNPGIQPASPVSPTLAGEFFTIEPPGKLMEVKTTQFCLWCLIYWQ